MSFKVLALLLLLDLVASSIYLSVKPKVPRCMVEYVAGGASVSSMKIKVDFPAIENKKVGEHFQVSLRNTETNKISEEVVESGEKYYRQAELQHNVIYEICIIFRSDKDTQVIVEYEAENRFEDVESFSEAAYPKNLLKKEDFKESFVAASHIAKTVEEYTQEHKQRESQNYKEFAVTQKINAHLNWVSSVEVIVLLGAGAFQFFTLKNYLSEKQYI